MATGKPIPCEPCQEGKINTKADIWCYNCDKGLCLRCSGHHKRYKLSRDHRIIDIKIHKPSIHAIRSVCDKHGQHLNLYCPCHLMPFCEECISSSHSKCTGIKYLAGVVEKTNIEKSKESLHKDIYSTLDILNELVNVKSGNNKRGEQQCDSIKGRIAELRKEINTHLDHLEEKIYQKIDNTLNQEKSKTSNLITEIEEKKVELKEMKEHLHGVKTHSSKLQSFLEVHQIEQEVHQCLRYVEGIEDDDRVKEFEIKLKQNDEINNTISKLESLESLGEVFVDKTRIRMKRESSVRRGSQVKAPEQSNINNMTMNIETKIRINMEKKENMIGDMICLMDGRVIIVVENLRKVHILTADGKLQKKLSIPGKASSVSQINQDSIALTFFNEKAIKLFNMKNGIVYKVITLNKKCSGLSFSNSCLIVGLNANEIRFIDLEGTTLISIPVQSESLLSSFVHYNDRVIYADYTGSDVYCVDKTGVQIWGYKQDLSEPVGLCTDLYGNIIVTDHGSNRILVISKDGQNSKVLLSEEGGLKYPWRICFKSNESSGFISDYFGKYLTKFNLCSK